MGQAHPGLLAFLLGLVVIGGVFLHLLPRLARPEIYFAVTVPVAFRDSELGRAILRGYRARLWAHTALAVAAILTGSALRFPVLIVLGMVWQVFAAMYAFYACRRKVMPHAIRPSGLREAELTLRERSLPGGTVSQLGPFAILLLAAVYLRARWEEIPLRFPVHWGMDGHPDRWATRSALGVYGPLLVGGLMCAALVAVAWGILHRARRVRASGPWAGREERFRWTQLSLLLGCGYFIALTCASMALLPLLADTEGRGPALWIYLAGIAVFAVGVVAVLVHTGQGGTRLEAREAAPVEENSTGPVGDRTPDAGWKAGIFYWNPDDPALFVETRFGVGYTLNLGQVWAWVFLAILVGLPVTISYLMRGTR